MKLLICVFFLFFANFWQEVQCWRDRPRFPLNQMLNKEDRSRGSLSNLIMAQYQEEKMTFDRLKKLAYKPHQPAPKLYYYYNPVEALRFEYQSLVPQTNDFTPIRFNPALWRAHHGYGFNEWGGQGIL